MGAVSGHELVAVPRLQRCDPDSMAVRIASKVEGKSSYWKTMKNPTVGTSKMKQSNIYLWDSKQAQQAIKPMQNTLKDKGSITRAPHK